VESAFEVDPETRAMDLVALFSDGTHVRLPNALVGDLFLLSEDIANRLTIPAFFFMKGENPTWETPLIERAAGSLRLN